MAVTVAKTFLLETINGEGILVGTATADADYNATSGGIVMDISAYLGGDVKVIPACNAGYVPAHNDGTAAAGRLQIYEAGADSAALDEVADSTDLSNIVFQFVAIGTTL